MKPILKQLSKRFLANKPSNFKRYLYEKIDFDTKIIGIVGARGSGKTTLLHQYAKSVKYKPSQILYISCDHPAMSEQDLYELADEFYTHGGKLLILDEIHKIKDFALHIKSMYDFTNLHVLFSGSSAINIEHETADLSRRALVYHLNILSFREFMSLKEIVTLPSYSLEELLLNHEDIVVDIISHVKPLEYFQDYLEYGAYPFFKEGVNSYADKLLEVVRTTIDSDLASLFKIGSDRQDILKKILYMLCCTTPYEINKAKLSKEVGIAWSTLAKYLEYMQKGSLLHLVPGSRGHKTVQLPNKILLNNTNLFNVLCSEADKGAIRESFFVSQLSYKYRVHYHHEGDFLIEDKYVIEVGGKSKDKKQIQNLKNAFLAIDDIESGYENSIPLWLFGFLY